MTDTRHRSKIGLAIRISFSALGLLIFGALLAAGIWAIRLHGNPFLMLERDPASVTVVRDSSYTKTTLTGESRIYRDIQLDGDGVGPVRITLSLPAGALDSVSGTLPVVFVLGGLEIGRESLSYITRQGRNALVAYEYPYSSEYWYEGMPLTEIPVIQKAILSVPAQVAAAFRWVSGESWADRDRVVLLGYSFGAFFVPAAYRVVERSGVPLRCSVMAYGGDDLNLLLRTNMDLTPGWWRDLLAFAAATTLAPMEPARHVPHIEDDMLLLNGNEDPMIPKVSVETLRRLKPLPKTIVNLDAGHMHPNFPGLTARIVDESRRWLIEKGAVEPAVMGALGVAAVSAKMTSTSSYWTPRVSAASWASTVVAPSPTSINPVARMSRPDW